MSLRVNIALSKRSQELIKQYINLSQPQATGLEQFNSSIEYDRLTSWLHKKIIIPPETIIGTKQEIEFVLAALRAELLHDLLISMGGENDTNKRTEENTSTVATLKFLFLALAGTLLVGCEGFDSITTMLGVLSLPSLLILVTGLGFSILSIIVFYSYDLIQISKNLGITLRDTPKLLDIYTLQMKEIRGLRKKIDGFRLAELSKEELLQLHNALNMLQARFQSLVAASIQFDRARNNSIMLVAKALISSIAGLLFFGSGFFAGQSVAMFAAAFFIPAVLPTFWPVVLFSTIVGLAAFAFYLHFEQEGLTKLVSRWFGLDEDKIEELCNMSKLDKERGKLELLKQKITYTVRLTEQLEQLQNKLVEMDEKSQTPKEFLGEQAALLLKTSTNIHCFHAQPKLATHQEHDEVWDSENTLPLPCH